MAHSDPAFILLEIRRKGALGDGRLADATHAFDIVTRAHPSATLHLWIGGYDCDPREVWEIEDARTYVARFADRLGEAGFHRLDDPTRALMGLCLGVLEVIAKDAVGALTLAPVAGFGGPLH